MAALIHDPIEPHHGGAYAVAFASQLPRVVATLEALDPTGLLSPAARRALITQLVRRWIGCTVTAFVADGRAPATTFAWQTFLVTYPVCTRLLAESEHAWRRDCELLLAAVAREAPGVAIDEVQHDAGFLGSRRSAHLLTLADGRRLVYRPYALHAARWFLDVCEAINPALAHPLHVRPLRVDGEHTWDAFVEGAPCPADAIARYLWRAGALVRLLEATCAQDMHVLNVRMAGEHPVLLDLEGVLAWRGVPTPLTSGFLPTRGFGGLNPGGVVTLPIKQPRFVDGRFEEVEGSKDLRATIPAPLEAHVDDVIAGYRALDAALGAVDLTALVERARTIKSSVFVRTGIAYRALLFASLDARLLRSEDAREEFIAANSEPIERSSLRSLRAVRYVGVAPVPALRPHEEALLAINEERIRDAIASGRATRGSAG